MYVVLVYYIQDDFFCVVLLYFLYLVQCFLLCYVGMVFIVGILVNMVFFCGVVKSGINFDDNILYVKMVSQMGNQCWVSQCWGVDRDFICFERKNFGGVVN